MKWTRRHMLIGAGGVATVVAAAAAGVELVDHGVLPGKSALDEISGACAVPVPTFQFGPLGGAVSGRFFSRSRNRSVGYAIAYPPGHGPGSLLPLIVVLHAFGATHADPLSGLSLAQAAALRIGGRALPPVALVAADGGGGYWNQHPGDDPMGMVVHELIPMCQRRGLGSSSQRVGSMGISMGGYGALLIAEKYPNLITAVAAISPAIWTAYAEAKAANAGAYASASDFATNDVVTHADALNGVAVRVASGTSDPFHPGVVAMAAALPAGAVVDVTAGCHDGSFFTSQMEPSLSFLTRALST